jgi:RimJ/RimL family protein N-acetyltransferase
MQTYPGMSVRAGDVTLRQPTAADIHFLARRVTGGLSLPEHLPNALWPWYNDNDPRGSARRFSRDMYAAWDCASINPYFPFVVVVNNNIVGSQALQVVNGPYRYSRELHTSSWLIPEARGQGFGYAARQAALHLAFNGIGAEIVRSETHHNNDASQAISLKCGYETDGTSTRIEHGKRAHLQRFVISRRTWSYPHHIPFTVAGCDVFAINLETQTSPGELS